MTPATPTHYQITVNAHQHHHWSDSFGNLTIVRNDDGTRLITAGQAQLHGLLTGLRDLDAGLISLRTIEPPSRCIDDVPAAHRPAHTPAGHGC